MSRADISQAKNPDLRGSMAAMRRAAALARKTAIQTDTAIVLVRDGKVVRIPAAELRAGIPAKPGNAERNWSRRFSIIGLRHLLRQQL